MKAPFHRTTKESAAAIAQLIALVERSSGSVSNTYDAPQVFIVAPPQTGEMPHPYIAEHFSGAQVESKGFGEAYHKVAKTAGVPFLDATGAIGVTAG